VSDRTVRPLSILLGRTLLSVGLPRSIAISRTGWLHPRVVLTLSCETVMSVRHLRSRPPERHRERGLPLATSREATFCQNSSFPSELIPARSPTSFTKRPDIVNHARHTSGTRMGKCTTNGLFSITNSFLVGVVGAVMSGYTV